MDKNPRVLKVAMIVGFLFIVTMLVVGFYQQNIKENETESVLGVSTSTKNYFQGKEDLFRLIRTQLFASCDCGPTPPVVNWRTPTPAAESVLTNDISLRAECYIEGSTISAMKFWWYRYNPGIDDWAASEYTYGDQQYTVSVSNPGTGSVNLPYFSYLIDFDNAPGGVPDGGWDGVWILGGRCYASCGTTRRIAPRKVYIDTAPPSVGAVPDITVVNGVAGTEANLTAEDKNALSQICFVIGTDTPDYCIAVSGPTFTSSYRTILPMLDLDMTTLPNDTYPITYYAVDIYDKVSPVSTFNLIVTTEEPIVVPEPTPTPQPEPTQTDSETTLPEGATDLIIEPPQPVNPIVDEPIAEASVLECPICNCQLNEGVMGISASGDESCEGVKVSGYTFQDLSKDYDKGVDEPAVENIEIQIYPRGDTEKLLVSVKSDAVGYWETYLCEGDYDLRPVDDNSVRNFIYPELIQVEVRETPLVIDVWYIRNSLVWLLLILLALVLLTAYLIYRRSNTAKSGIKNKE